VSSEWSFPFRLSKEKCVHISHLHACCIPRSCCPWYDHPTILMKIKNYEAVSSAVEVQFGPKRLNW
jgi:hypothetical protein